MNDKMHVAWFRLLPLVLAVACTRAEVGDEAGPPQTPEIPRELTLEHVCTGADGDAFYDELRITNLTDDTYEYTRHASGKPVTSRQVLTTIGWLTEYSSLCGVGLARHQIEPGRVASVRVRALVDRPFILNPLLMRPEHSEVRFLQWTKLGIHATNTSTGTDSVFWSAKYPHRWDGFADH